MQRRLVLSRRPLESVTLFVGGERIEVKTNLRTTLVFEAGENVRIVRTELLRDDVKRNGEERVARKHCARRLPHDPHRSVPPARYG